jgi:hypothetical protein
MDVLTMSLFGGDGGRGLPSPSQSSDFSIVSIGDSDGRAGSQNTHYGRSEDDEHEEMNGQAEAGAQQRDQQVEARSRSGSATSDNSQVPSFRSNRFRRSDGAWLHLTQAERSLAKALDQLKASDLGLHLYTAHHLKARLRSSFDRDSLNPWSGKSRWIDTNGETRKPWYPHSDWTAWPLAPENAPDPNDTSVGGRDDLDELTLPPTESVIQSHNLRDQLHAVLLARAHLSWKTKTRFPEQTGYEPIRDHATSSLSIDSKHHIASPHASPVGDENEEKSLFHPVFSADDDRSHAILQPIVNHVMSKLDKLLLALHHSRQAHLERPRDGHSNSESSARSSSRSRSTSNKPPQRKPSSALRSTRRSRRNTQAASRQPTQPDYVMVDDSGEDETYEPRKRRAPSSSSNRSSSDADGPDSSQTHRKRRNKRKPGIRDWSEVLGMAALSGMDPKAIERARERCSALFGEDMHMTVLAENDRLSADTSSAVDHVDHTGSWKCPWIACIRHMHPYEHGFRWREHMRKKHKYDKAQVETLEERLIRSGELVPATKRFRLLAHNPRGWEPPDPLVCPHCPTSQNIFDNVNLMIQHLKRAHKYDPRTDRPPKHSLGRGVARDGDDSQDEQGSSDDDNDEDMVGGAHNDGFLQPVLKNARSRGKDVKKRARRCKSVRSKTRA